jgi:glycosyltransferase 2 family protein
LLIHLLPVEPLRAALGRVPFTRFMAVLAVYLMVLSVGITKWHLVVNTAGAGLRFATSAQCYTSGLFGALFLPSIIGGDVTRLAVGMRRSAKPAAVVMGNVADRLLDIASQLTLVTLGLLLLPGSLPRELQAPARRLLVAGIFFALGAGFLTIAISKPLLTGRSVQWRRRIAQVRHAIRAVGRRPDRLLFGWVLGTCVQGSYVVLTGLLGISCGLVLPLRVWLFAWPLAKIAAVMPITQGGMGVREAALVLLLAPFGAPPALVLATGLVWEGIIVTGGLIAGTTALALRKAVGRNPIEDC